MGIRLAALGLALLLPLSAQTVEESFARDPGPLDFIRGEGMEQAILQSLAGDALVGLDAGGRVVPRLALRWEVRKQALRFHLRPDARFADGTPVEAEDVAWTLRELQTREGASPSRRGLLEGVACRVCGPREVELQAPRPPRRLLAELARVAIARRGRPDLGSGPYACVCSGTAWTLTARPHFLKPAIPAFRFRLVPDALGLQQQVAKGWLSLAPAPARRSAKPPAGYRELVQPMAAQAILWSRLGPGPLAWMERWRQAVPAELFGGRARPSRGLWPECLGFAPRGLALPPPPARGQRWELLYTAGDDLVQKALLALRARAAQDGVTLDLRPVEAALLYARLLKGDFALAVACHLFEPHPWAVLDYLLPKGGLNFTGWAHPRLAALEPRLDAPESPAWAELQALWAAAPGALPLLDLSSVLWVDTRLKVTPSPLGLYLSTPGAAGWRWEP